MAIADNPSIIVTARHVAAGVQAEMFRQQADTGIPCTASILSLRVATVQDDGKEALEVAYVGAPMGDWSFSPNDDIAIAVIPPGAPGPTVGMPMADLAEISEGFRIATCGWPYGTEIHGDNPILSSFLWGKICLVAPYAEVSPQHHRVYWAQMPVNPGNSGGGVFCPETGRLVGIVSRRLLAKGIPAGLAEIVPLAPSMPAIRDALTGAADAESS